jgi:Ca2+/Na+ antiporter
MILYNLQQTTIMFRFIALQIFFIITGSIHVYLYRRTFNSLRTDKIHIEILFALLTAFLMSIALLLLIAFNNDFSYLYDFFVALIAFVFHTLIYVLYNTSVSIPIALYNKWYYPVTKIYENAGVNEFKNTIVLDLYFYKGADNKDLTRFKVKAPKAMNFGRLFFFFVTEYNEKNLGEQISLFESDQTPNGWYFFTKPNWYGKTKRIDTDLSVENNNLQDKMSIICQRIETNNSTE